MSTDRGRRRTARSNKNNHALRSRRVVRLAPGVRLDGTQGKNGDFVLVSADGKVQLNSTAVAILGLCDGSRDRDEIVTEVMRRSPRQALAMEIAEFLAAARARGWIVEA